MKRSLFLAVIGLVSLAGAGFAQETVDEALALFAESGDVHVSFSDEGQAQVERIIEILLDALGVPEYLDETSESEVGAFPVALEDKNLVNKLSQAYYTYADAFLRDLPNQRETFLKGKLWGLKSLRMNPAFVSFEEQENFVTAIAAETDVPAIFWTNANWLRWAEPDILDAIRGGIAPKSLAMNERLLALDPSYSTYAPYRTLGAFWQGLPSGVLLALFTGGLEQDYEKALDAFCHIVEEPTYCSGTLCYEVDPVCHEYFENRIVFAQYYLMPLDHWEDAARVLQSVLDEDIGDTFPLYNGLNQAIAAELLAEVQEHL